MLTRWLENLDPSAVSTFDPEATRSIIGSMPGSTIITDDPD
eukprot:gene11574-19997_t